MRVFRRLKDDPELTGDLRCPACHKFTLCLSLLAKGSVFVSRYRARGEKLPRFQVTQRIYVECTECGHAEDRTL